MSRKFIDRTGEENRNNFGSKIIIVEYRGALDIDVYFEEYDWTARSVAYCNFKKGEIKCPYEKRYYGIGYIGEGRYSCSKDSKAVKCYEAWCNMLQRCYDEKYHEKELTYKNCAVDNNWLNFQNFAKWYYDNYYEIEGERMHLDKDILVKGNKIYSSDTCIFVPERINSLFTKSNKCRGEYPIGVYYDKQTGKFRAQCRVYDLKERKGKTINLKRHNTPEEAFYAYKEFKENYIKEVADYYKDKIPQKLYNAMYQYKVEITD